MIILLSDIFLPINVARFVKTNFFPGNYFSLFLNISLNFATFGATTNWQ